MSLPVFLLDGATAHQLDELHAAHAGGAEFSPLPQVGGQVTVTGAEAKHMNVMRLEVGDGVVLTNGRAGVRGQIISLGGPQGPVTVLVEEAVNPPARPRVSVIQALPKSERSELTVDLLTQAGAEEIIPWQSARAIAKWGNKSAKARAKWHSQALASAKQSRRVQVPVIGELYTSLSALERLVAERAAAGEKVLILHEDATESLAQLSFEGAPPVTLIIGPEGGISPEEVTVLTHAGGQLTLLGPEVLRTATAGMVALSALGAKYRW